jgi:signal transduction histidine kinase
VNDKVKELLLSNNIDSKNKTAENILCREIRKPDDLISTILIVDRRHVLATELKDDSKEFFEEAIGLTTYSKSKPTILLYISIFESLWAQTEMSEDLKIANEKLLKSEHLEREFISIAAHELRTPTKAIMGYTELDKEILEDILKNAEAIKNEELRNKIIHLSKHFDALSRNASRLDGLINNLLDVAKIESNSINSLQLQKEKIDLVKVINNSIDTELQQKIKQKEIKINFINDVIDEHYWIYVDKLRLYQIINNLIGNAIKFSRKNGKIDTLIKADAADSDNIVIRKQETIEGKLKSDIQEGGKDDTSKEQIFVGISDTGKGISPQIMPNLFKSLSQIQIREQV